MVWTIEQSSDNSSLVDRIFKGDRSAEEEFIALFEQRVSIMVLMRTHDREVTRDLVQEIMIGTLQALRKSQLRKEESLACFVHGVARNVINNYFRSQNKDLKQIPISADPVATNPPDSLETSDRQRIVRLSLEQLKPMDRKILVMTLVDGLKPGQIAEHLSLNLDVVRQRKSRAIRNIIKYVERMSRI